MPQKNTYSSGEFAKRANVSIRTIRYYDEKGLLKPSYLSDAGYRLYSDHDFAKLQRIIVLKKLGFSLEDIADLSGDDKDSDFIARSFDLQLKLVRERIVQLRQIEQTLREASLVIPSTPEPDWNKMIGLIHLLNMEETLSKQYKNSKNVDARIKLHRQFSVNPQGWFGWIYDQLPIRKGQRILEVGCGNGQLWLDNLGSLPENIQIVLSDLSSGMLQSARKNLGDRGEIFQYSCFDFQEIPFEAESFDIVIANHVLFYAKDREKALRELLRVLKKGGTFCCSTYGRQHMKEIELLAKEYDERIGLSEVKLYDIFGLDHGEEELLSFYREVTKQRYEDSLLVTEVPLLAEYIYSCHGNQMDILKEQQASFERFLKQKIGKKGLYITKDAGIFLCRNTP